MPTHDDDSNVFGERLREAREAEGLSIRAAARAAGFSEGRWRQLESGHELRQGTRIPVNPKPSTVVQAADAVGLDARLAIELAGMPDADLFEIRRNEMSELLNAISSTVKVLESGMRPKDRQIEMIVQQSRTFLSAAHKEDHPGTAIPLTPFKEKLDYLEELWYRIDQPDAWHPNDGPRSEVDENHARREKELRLDELSVPLPEASLSARLNGLDLAGLLRLRDMIEGAITAKEHPSIEEELQKAEIDFARSSEALRDTTDHLATLKKELQEIGTAFAQLQADSGKLGTSRIEELKAHSNHLEAVSKETEEMFDIVQRNYTLAALRVAILDRFQKGSERGER